MSFPIVERKVDELGRIVLPIDLRRALDISEHDTLEIHTEGSAIVLRKKQRTCVFCGETQNTTEFRGRNICPRCRRELVRRFGTPEA